MDATEAGKLSYSAYLDDEDVKEFIPEFDLIESTKDYKVFRDPLKNRTVVSFKGSGADINDWKANTLTLFHLGHYSKQYKNGLKTVKKLIEQYGRDNVECTGHSKGASQCSQISKDTGIQATVFSKPKQIAYTRNSKNETSIIVGTDPVGSTSLIPGLPTKAKRIKQKKLNPHSALNFV